LALSIRPIEATDVDVLVELGRLMHVESPRYREFPFSEAKVRATIKHLFERGGGFVADLDGTIVGMIGALRCEHWFSEAAFTVDVALYVLPEHRGSLIAVRLVRVYEAWAATQNVVEVILGVSTGVMPLETVNLYERMGYEMVAYSLRKKNRSDVNV
jgi:GNAT superfamily N-acetyltransferase